MGTWRNTRLSYSRAWSFKLQYDCSSDVVFTLSTLPCKDVEFSTVIRGLSSIFSIFGLPSYIHSDRGPSLVSKELQNFLHSRYVATSKTMPYNPQGNGQCKKYNDIIWRTTKLACKSQNLDVKYWESVLPNALHSIRSLLCTATNITPLHMNVSFHFHADHQLVSHCQHV